MNEGIVFLVTLLAFIVSVISYFAGRADEANKNSLLIHLIALFWAVCASVIFVSIFKMVSISLTIK